MKKKEDDTTQWISTTYNREVANKISDEIKARGFLKLEDMAVVVLGEELLDKLPDAIYDGIIADFKARVDLKQVKNVLRKELKHPMATLFSSDYLDVRSDTQLPLWAEISSEDKYSLLAGGNNKAAVGIAVDDVALFDHSKGMNMSKSRGLSGSAIEDIHAQFPRKADRLENLPVTVEKTGELQKVISGGHMLPGGSEKKKLT
jgi:hypothetical protein